MSPGKLPKPHNAKKRPCRTMLMQLLGKHDSASAEQYMRTDNFAQVLAANV